MEHKLESRLLGEISIISDRVLTGVEQIEPGEKLDLRLADGTLACRVEERKCL